METVAFKTSSDNHPYYRHFSHKVWVTVWSTDLWLEFHHLITRMAHKTLKKQSWELIAERDPFWFLLINIRFMRFWKCLVTIVSQSSIVYWVLTFWKTDKILFHWEKLVKEPILELYVSSYGKLNNPVCSFGSQFCHWPATSLFPVV